MIYVLSKYICFKSYGDIVVGVNLFKNILFAFQINKYDKLLLHRENLKKLKTELPVFFNTMVKLGVITDIESDNNVSQIILYRNRKEIFETDSYRLVIIPTLNCNFNCWYCFEKNRPKHIMNEETINSTIKFLNNTIKNKSTFFLDWYGGEPLLCFNNIMKPLSEQIKNLCDKNNVFLESQITTNGYLLNEKMIPLFKSINMQIFQITLNGPRSVHNEVRFQKNTTDSYDRIVNNIILLAQELSPRMLILRINFGKNYFDSITDIIESFPLFIRKRINIFMEQINQEKERIPFVEIEKKMSEFENAGFNVEIGTQSLIHPNMCFACTADKYNQAVLNYDGRIFKCYSINYEDEKEDGFLTNKGTIKWNEEILSKKLGKATFDNKECMNCKYLPVCFGMCNQRFFQIYNSIKLENRCIALNNIETKIYNIMDKFKASGKALACISDY
jgi:uncharacterized protein